MRKRVADAHVRGQFRRLLSLAMEQRFVLLVALSVSVAVTVVTLTQPLILGRLIDGLSAGSSIRGWVILLLVLFLSAAGLSAWQDYLLGRSGEDIVLSIRSRLVDQLVRMTIGNHDRYRAGDLLSRVSADTIVLRTALTSSITNAVSAVLALVGATILMLLIDVVLFAVTLACVSIALISLLTVFSRVREASEAAQTALGQLSAALDRVLGAIRTVKISGAEEREVLALVQEAEGARHAGVRTVKLEAMITPVNMIAIQGSFVLVLGLGGARVASGAISLGDLATFLLYLIYLVAPLGTAFNSFADLQRGLAALSRIDDILGSETENSNAERTPNLDMPERRSVVCFESVNFGYEPSHPVLREVSFTVPEFSRTALIGASGVGKTTIFALLEKFYEVDSGRILLDGQDISRLPVSQLRKKIGYVEQTSPVMAGTIRSNLLYACPNATEYELNEVLELTNLKTFIRDLPHGLETQVGDDGLLLSGGERQRIAIARTLLLRPRLLLLDEVTSQLDSKNEIALREAVAQVSEQCTVMVIAHRLSTVSDADQIVLLQDGAVINIGTHSQLLSDGLYRELVAGQLVEGQATDS